MCVFSHTLSTPPQADNVFDADCESLTQQQRSLSSLVNHRNDGFIIWHEYVVARARPQKGELPQARRSINKKPGNTKRKPTTTIKHKPTNKHNAKQRKA
jgi:hypothetical protein